MSPPQPIPPSWKDLGKSSNDLLNKEYPFNGASLEVKTSTPSNVSFKVFKVAGNKHSKSDIITGDLEGKWADKVHGLTVTQTWTTSNILRNTVELEDQIAKGLKLDLATSLAPKRGAKTAVLGSVYKQSGFHTRATLDLFKGPTFTADAVLGCDGFLVGAEAAYNVTEGKVTRYATAVGFNAPQYSVAVHALNNLKVFTASYYQRINSDVEAGAKAVYDPKSTAGGVNFEVGTKFYLDRAAFIKAKINNAGVIGLGYTQALRPGVKAQFGLAIDTQELNDPTPFGPWPKVGVNFVFGA